MALEMATQVEDRIWDAEGERKREAVRDLFTAIAPRYDLMNSLMSLSLHRRWRQFAVAQLELQKGDDALDVCCGTGDFLPPLRQAIGASGKLLGIDFCEAMIVRATGKADAVLSIGDACNLPVKSGSVNAVTVGWGIRNVPDIDVAHREIFRVLRPNGRFVSLDMAQPKQPLLRRISGFMFNAVVPVMGAISGNAKAYTYLPKSTAKFWSREELMESMKRAGLVDIRYRDLFLGNICLHVGRKP